MSFEPSGSGGGSSLAFSQVLSADTATLDTGANGIPSTGGILTVYAVLRTDEVATGSSVALRFNGDSGTNYDGNRVQAINVTASAASTGVGASSVSFVAAAASDTANIASSMNLVMPNYAAATTLFRTGLMYDAIPDETAANQIIQVRGVNWRSTAAINQVSLAITSGAGQKFKAGSGIWVFVQ